MRRQALPPNVPSAVLSTAQLRARGLANSALTAAVRNGLILRARRGRYLPPGTHAAVVHAVELGGVVDCISLLVLIGVFVMECAHLHIAVPGDSTRLPAPSGGVVRHWRNDQRTSSDTVAPIIGALRQAVRCQPPRHALASLDSALNLRVIDQDDLREIFASLPARFGSLRRLVDARSESGTETFVRLMLRALGCLFDVQVKIPHVGRVDFVVDGWLIVECDSEAHHRSWDQRCRDIRRDQEAAAQGYTTIRLLAADILYHPDVVLDVLRRVIEGRPTPARPRRHTRRTRRSR